VAVAFRDSPGRRRARRGASAKHRRRLRTTGGTPAIPSYARRELRAPCRHHAASFSVGMTRFYAVVRKRPRVTWLTATTGSRVASCRGAPHPAAPRSWCGAPGEGGAGVSQTAASGGARARPSVAGFDGPQMRSGSRRRADARVRAGAVLAGEWIRRRRVRFDACWRLIGSRGPGVGVEVRMNVQCVEPHGALTASRLPSTGRGRDSAALAPGGRPIQPASTAWFRAVRRARARPPPPTGTSSTVVKAARGRVPVVAGWHERHADRPAAAKARGGGAMPSRRHAVLQQTEPIGMVAHYAAVAGRWTPARSVQRSRPHRTGDLGVS
jgi:hypothetical protein